MGHRFELRDENDRIMRDPETGMAKYGWCDDPNCPRNKESAAKGLSEPRPPRRIALLEQVAEEARKALAVRTNEAMNHPDSEFAIVALVPIDGITRALDALDKDG